MGFSFIEIVLKKITLTKGQQATHLIHDALIRKIDKAKEFKMKHDAQYYPSIQTTGDLKVMTGSGYDHPELFIFLLYMPIVSALKQSMECFL